jgi:hypothetical protein
MHHGRVPSFSALATAGLILSSAACGNHSSNNSPPQTGPTVPYDGGMPLVGQVPNVPTKLPQLPSMTNVVAALNDDSVDITFDPYDGALDYRVYPLPADGDINVQSDGTVVVNNAMYRCAGNRETPTPQIDNGANPNGAGVDTEVNGQMIGGYLRTTADATLGYVYTQPGPGLVPVYALGEANSYSDNSCYWARWAASRVKKYTTSDAARTQLLASLARDDGVAFYVPSAADSTTTQIYEDDVGQAPYITSYYLKDGAEAMVHPTKQPAFLARAMQASGTVPLMRVYYANECGASHDELAAGTERFNRIYKQGDQQPWWTLLWAGITGPTTLVVEALDKGCPYQGFLSPTSIASVTANYGGTAIVHPAYETMDQMRAASSTGEVFINGQMDPSNRPKAIARAFLKVAPNPHPKMDFFASFSPNSTPETYTTVPCGAPTGNCFAAYRQQSPTFDQSWIYMESGPTSGSGLFAYGQMMGEFWVAYADNASDTAGKFRMTANQKATMSADKFLHVTMEVDAYSTARRYPQFLISDQDAPVQYLMQNGHTLVVEPIGEITPSFTWPIDYKLEICNKRTWDVNDQCPSYDLYHIMDSAGKVANLAPNDEVGEHDSVDHRVVFDIFASTQRAYLYLDEKPYGCAELPSSTVPNGPVTVTWGDVLYHSGVDQTLAFHKAHMQTDTRRHFDNLGFSSGVSAPTWDETRLPCAPAISP